VGVKGVGHSLSPMLPPEGLISRNTGHTAREETKSDNAEYPDSVPTSLKLASLATAWITQGRELRVRQREELRRALNRLANIRTWVALRADPPASAIRDVEEFTTTGLRIVQRELRDELAEKKSEVTRLKEVAEFLNELARAEEWGDPVEVEYSHTIRQPEGLATQTTTLTLVDTEEAKVAAEAFEKKLQNWEKLRSQMQAELESRKRQLKEIAGSVSAFAAFSSGVVADVLALISQTG